MSLNRATLRQLRALAATIRSGSVTAAAQELNVTPPAVSLQLKLLEELAGIALLERAETGMRATGAGRELADTALRIDALLSEAEDAIGALKGARAGHVRVGVVSTAKYFSPRVLAAFKRAHPGVEIQLSVGNREQTIAALETFAIDFAVMGRPPNRFDVDRSIIGPHPHIIVAPPDHVLARRRYIPPRELSSETFLMREPGSGTRMLTERLLADTGATPSIGMEIESNETIKQAVMAGLGIALLSAHTVSVELEDGRLVMLDVVGLPIMRQWFVVRRAERRMMPAAATLWEFFAAEGGSFLPQLVIEE
ncbi:LysR family transcriptional regulator [Dongia deserti]|uniref:LysR family transcriptional regulator n=1 Tax=Dongia deserti TaxID=2268030 RepID=UPI000E6558D7|nr:LysR family transcriptional regulator [Dongia deserti]